MSEYIDIDSRVSFTDTRGKKVETTIRHLFERNEGAYIAADVREVVRAHWYWDKDGMDWGIGAWRCSACHSRPETWWQGESNSPRNKSGHYFCPNCGAWMEAGDRDEL